MDLQTIPPKYYTVGEVMSNFDGRINPAAEEILKKARVYGEYPGWNFSAAVWFDRAAEKFMCMVQRFHEHIETISADSLEEIMESVSNKYGYE